MSMFGSYGMMMITCLVILSSLCEIVRTQVLPALALFEFILRVIVESVLRRSTDVAVYQPYFFILAACPCFQFAPRRFTSGSDYQHTCFWHIALIFFYIRHKFIVTRFYQSHPTQCRQMLPIRRWNFCRVLYLHWWSFRNRWCRRVDKRFCIQSWNRDGMIRCIEVGHKLHP